MKRCSLYVLSFLLTCSIGLMVQSCSPEETEQERQESEQLEADQRRHAFIAAAIQGSRTQTLKMQRKGLQIPDCTDS